METMKKKLKDNLSFLPVREGEIVEGKVVKTGKSSVFLDLGSKGTGIIYGREFEDAKDYLKELKTGQSACAKVMDVDNEQGYVELSLTRAHKELVWQELQKTKTKNQTIKVKIIGANKGGLLAKVSGIVAFLPVSQLSQEHYPKVPGAETAKILRALQQFVGQELEVKIFDISPKQEKLILSEKIKEAEKRRLALQNYKTGDIIEGRITSIADFGAFMEFSLAAGSKAAGQEEEPDASGAHDLFMEGLVHISELSDAPIRYVSEAVKVGEVVRARIIDIADDKVALSLKGIKNSPKSK